MPLTHDMIGSDENLARRVLVRARNIAPCIDTFANNSEEQKDAIAILKGVIAEIPAPGSRRVRSKSRNGTSISYSDIGSAFSDDDITALRSLCASSGRPGDPIGSFPSAQPVAGVWPEGDYSS